MGPPTFRRNRPTGPPVRCRLYRPVYFYKSTADSLPVWSFGHSRRTKRSVRGFKLSNYVHDPRFLPYTCDQYHRDSPYLVVRVVCLLVGIQSGLECINFTVLRAQQLSVQKVEHHGAIVNHGTWQLRHLLRILIESGGHYGCYSPTSHSLDLTLHTSSRGSLVSSRCVAPLVLRKGEAAHPVFLFTAKE